MAIKVRYEEDENGVNVTVDVTGDSRAKLGYKFDRLADNMAQAMPAVMSMLANVGIELPPGAKVNGCPVPFPCGPTRPVNAPKSKKK